MWPGAGVQHGAITDYLELGVIMIDVFYFAAEYHWVRETNWVLCTVDDDLREAQLATMLEF